VRAANDLGAKVIITITETGSTSRLCCKYRPRVPVLCVTSQNDTANFLMLTRGAVPIVVPSLKGTDNLVVMAMNRAKDYGFAKSGDQCVVISGVLELQPGNSNNLRVLTIP
jgi:pyruvate kinase